MLPMYYVGYSSVYIKQYVREWCIDEYIFACSLAKEELLEDRSEVVNPCTKDKSPLPNCRRPKDKSNMDFKFFEIPEKPTG